MSKRNPEHFCGECGSSIREYKHRLNSTYLELLRKVADAGPGPVNLNKLKYTYSQRANFQKLRYFGLVMPEGDPDGKVKRRNSCWLVTDLGYKFLRGEARVHPLVWTYRAEPTRFEGEPVDVYDLELTPEAAVTARQYAAEAIAHGTHNAEAEAQLGYWREPQEQPNLGLDKIGSAA